MNVLSELSYLKLTKEEYIKKIKPLKFRLEELQREIKEKQIPILIIFEGLESSGKGEIINEILVTLDPRGYKVFNHNHPLEQTSIPLKQYIDDLPGKGEFHIFDKSWYDFAYQEKSNITRRCKEINAIEHSLSKSGMLILRFFLYISKETQRKRYLNSQKNPSQSWKINCKSWKENFNYTDTIKRWEDILERTHNFDHPWIPVRSKNLYGAKYEIFKAMVKRIERHINSNKEEENSVLLPYKEMFSLDKVDLSKTIEKEKYKEELKKLQKRISDLNSEIYQRRIPVVIAYEGWDAAGKGGNIKRVVQNMDPRGYDVVPIGAPNDVEKNKHYLWRFWKAIPRNGHITIYDRTWYGRVLVERIEKFATKTEWKRSYEEIINMEKQWSSDGVVILKFWLHISKDEQLKRFEARENSKYKQWKITDEDWRNRERWEDYKVAVEEMVSRTSTKHATWHIVPANDKYYARIFVLKTIIRALEKRLYGEEIEKIDEEEDH